MCFRKTLPKAFLISSLIFAFLFMGAAPVNASLLGDIAGGFADFFTGGPVGVIAGQLFDFHLGSFLGNLIGGAAGAALDPIIKTAYAIIAGTIVAVTATLFAIAGSLVGVALDFNSEIARIAKLGYNITLGVANMSFIVALVVIAFATMLRQESFSYKKALPRLIIVALLINFGFFIVTEWLIAPVDQVTQAIRQAANFDIKSFGGFFTLDQFFEGFTSLGNFTNAGGAAGEIVKVLVGAILLAAFSFIGTITLFAFVIMFFIRGVALSILLILLPLAWASWIFPNLKLPGGINPWQEWWQQFTRWLLFAPFAMFFFYLTIQLANQGELFPDPDKNLFSAIGTMFAIVGLLLGGLLVSNRMGIAGAGIALGVVATGRVWAQAKVKKYSRKAGYATLKKTLPRERLQKFQRAGTGKYGKYGLRQIAAPIRAMGREIAVQTTAMTKAREAEFLEKIKNLAPYQISDMYAGLSEEEKAYALKHMIDKGYDWELVPEAREDIVKWAKKDDAGNSMFDKDVWGLKKAELDLIDMGISPDALAKMEEYRPAMAKAIQKRNEAKTPEGKAEHEKEIERIKYMVELEVEEILRKDMNVITASGMGKLQRRTFSSNLEKLDDEGKGTGEFKVGYQMFGNDEVGATMATSYGASEMRYINLDRADAVRRLKAATRGDGSTNLSRSSVENLEAVKDWFVAPLLTLEGIDEKDFYKMDAPAQIKLLQKHWLEVQERAKSEITRAVQDRKDKLDLSDEDYKKALEIELAKIERSVPERLIGNLRELVGSSRGSSHAVFTA